MELKDSRSYRVAAQRSRAKAMPKIPKDHDDMDPEKVGLGHLVLGRRKHPEEKNKDVILFGTLLSATAWARSQFKSGDGTFKMTVKSFYQTFILIALLGGVYVPCMIALLPDKSRESYDCLFSLIWDFNNNHGLANDFAEGFFMTDFELNIRLSFSMFWPNTRLLGCYFHFSQLIWKRVKGANHARDYERIEDFGHVVRMVSGLPFSPPDQLDQVFRLLIKKAEGIKSIKLKDFALGLVSYADGQWRKGPFTVQDWNLFNINVLMVPATNNGNEGTNGRFNTDFGVHPNFWNFLWSVKEVLGKTDTDIKQLLYASITPSTSPLCSVV